MRISDWSSDVCSSDLTAPAPVREDLAAVCAAAVERYREAARAAGVSLETEVAPGTAVWADPQSLPTIVGNLVSNAVKYSPAGGSVRLLGAAVPDGVRIQVIDHGYGVDPGRVPHVDRKSTRLTSSPQ